jgi:hypothetical protein
VINRGRAGGIRERLERLEALLVQLAAEEAEDACVELFLLPALLVRVLVAASDHILGGKDGVTLLAPGGHHEFTLYVHSMGPPPLFEILVRWQDASGIPGESRAELRVR